MFGDMDSDIQTRIPDRPQRPFPSKISDSPHIPWLASHYVPQANQRPSVKSMVNRIGRLLIPITGTILVVGFIGWGATVLYSYY